MYQKITQTISSFFSKQGRFLLTAAIALLAFTGTVEKAQATHMMGADIYYDRISLDSVKITLIFYRDCAGVGAPGSASAAVKSTACSVNASVPLTLQPPPASGTREVSPLCPPALANSTCSGGTNPGVEKYIYIGYYVIPASGGNCDDFVFSWNSCCRNNAITNLSNNGTQYIEAKMNNETYNSNTDTIYNSSPRFSSLPTPYVCINQPFNYNNGTTDPDNDSLAFTFINAKTGGGAGDTIAYAAGWSRINPVQSTPGIVIDTTSGQLTMTPITLQQAVVTILVEEWRDLDNDGYNETLVGSNMRDLQIVVQNCSNIQPAADTAGITSVTGGTKIDDYEVEVCPGDTLEFEFVATDANGDAILMTANISGSNMPSATWNTSCICANDTGTFWWVPTVADVGTHILVISVQDDGCPILGVQWYGVQITVLDGTYAGPDLVYCGIPVQLQASGGSTFVWTTVPGGDPINVPTNFSDDSISNPYASPTISTYYIVTSTQSSTCGNVDTAFVRTVTGYNVNGSNDTSICMNGTATLVVDPDATYSGYTYNWTPSSSLNVNNDSLVYAQPTTNTTYHVTITAPSGCERYDTVTVLNVGTAPIIYAYNDTSMCSGDTANLYSSTVANAIYAWTPSATISHSDSTWTRAYPTSTQVYTITATEYDTDDTIFWLEEFGSYANAIQTGTAGKWTTVQPTCGGCGSIQTQANRMEGTRINQAGRYWQSELIDISGYIDVNLKAQLLQIDYDASDGDSVNLYYSLDGGAWTYYTNGQQEGAFSAVTATALGLTGSTVQIRCYFRSDDASDRGRLDSVQVIGNALSICPGSDIVTVTTGANYTLSSSIGTNPICRLDQTTLTTTPSISGTFSYQWTPTSSLALATDTLQTTTANPSDTTTYYVTVSKDGCTKYDTVTLNVKAPAPIITAHYDSTYGNQLCQGDSAWIYAIGTPVSPCTTSAGNCSTSWSDTIRLGNMQDNKIFGIGSWTTYSKRAQTIYRASELATLGIGPNDMISDVRFLINGTPSGSYGNYVIKMGCTTTDGWNSSGNFVTTQQVKGSFSLTPVSGWNDISLDDGYIWDGSSNLVLDMCQDNFPSTPDLNIRIYIGDSVSAADPQRSLTATSTSVAQCGVTSGGMASSTVSVVPVVQFKFCSAPVAPMSNLKYTWTPSASTSNPNDSATWAFPTSTTTYLVEAYDSVNAGCVGDASVTIYAGSDYNITSITASPSNFCSGNSSSLSLTTDSSFSFTYLWTPGGTLDDSTAASPIATPTATTTYTAAVTRVLWGCTKTDSVTVTLDGITPDPTAITNVDTVCNGGSANLSVSLASGLYDTVYTWTPSTGLDDASSATPIATPSATTRYTVTVDDGGCTDTASVLITYLNASVTADTIGVCDPTDSIQLTATNITSLTALPSNISSCGANGTSYGSTSTVTQGSGASSFGGWANPFMSNGTVTDYRIQLLYKRADLHALGLDTTTGQVITAIAFELDGSSGGNTLNNFSVKMGCGNSSGLSTTWSSTPSTTVYTGSYTTTSSWNTVTLTSPYDWDGSDLQIEICYNNSSASTGTTTYLCDFTAVGINTVNYSTAATSGDGCTIASAAGASRLRPKTRFTYADAAGGYTYSWSPGSAMDDSTLANPMVLVPGGGQTYTVTVQGVECFATDDILVTCSCDTIKPYIEGSASIDTTEYQSDSTFRIRISELIKCNTITGASDFELDCTGSTTAAACAANSIIVSTGDGCPNPPDSTAQWISVEMDNPVPSTYANDWQIKISGTCTIRDVCWNLMTSVGSNGASGSAVILPIELLYFDGALNNDVVVLNWETTLEVKTDYYVVQRSVDGKQFQDIGTVMARGTYYQYEFKDYQPKAGVNYYRLKVMDTDGDHSYTRTIAVKIGEVNFELISVQPIPTLDNVNVRFNSNTTEELQVEVLNLLGKRMQNITYMPQVGENEVTVNMTELKAGVYFLNIHNRDDKTILTRIIKQ